MGDEWFEGSLADVCASIDYGFTASAEDAPIGPKFLRITDIVAGYVDWKSVPHVSADRATTQKYRLHEADIVLARTGASTGESLYIQEPPEAVFASYLVRLKVNERFDPRFVAYYLQSESFWSYIRGVLGDKSAQPNASASTMTKAPIRAPQDIGEQRAVGRVLGTLDDKIELDRRMNQTLEGIARALFKSWFVDFDPVRAKAEGRDPGLPAHIADLFPDRFEASELGEIPNGWRIGKVGEFVTLGRDGINPEEFPDEVFDHFSIPAFDDGRRPKAELGAAIKSHKFLVPADSVLLSKLNPRIPRIWLPVVGNDHRAICSTEFLVALRSAWASREFLYSCLSSEGFSALFETLVTGTSGSHQRVKPEDLLNIDAVVPDGEIVQLFTQVLRPVLKRVDWGRKEADTLASLRDALLPKLLSGEIRVGELERSVEGALP